jgi:malonate decarboxylase delta subunit
METLFYSFGPYAHSAALAGPVLVGVVGSGNMEALVEARQAQGHIEFEVLTSIPSYGPTWAAVLHDFAQRLQRGDLRVSINDAGATPAVVGLRLRQAQAELEAAA